MSNLEVATIALAVCFLAVCVCGWVLDDRARIAAGQSTKWTSMKADLRPLDDKDNKTPGGSSNSAFFRPNGLTPEEIAELDAQDFVRSYVTEIILFLLVFMGYRLPGKILREREHADLNSDESLSQLRKDMDEALGSFASLLRKGQYRLTQNIANGVAYLLVNNYHYTPRIISLNYHLIVGLYRVYHDELSPKRADKILPSAEAMHWLHSTFGIRHPQDS